MRQLNVLWEMIVIPTIKIFSFFQSSSTIPTSPRHPAIRFWYFFQPLLLFHTPCLLETLEYRSSNDFMGYLT